MVGLSARVSAGNGKPPSMTFTNGVELVDDAAPTHCDMGDEVNAKRAGRHGRHRRRFVHRYWRSRIIPAVRQ